MAAGVCALDALSVASSAQVSVTSCFRISVSPPRICYELLFLCLTSLLYAAGRVIVLVTSRVRALPSRSWNVSLKMMESPVIFTT